MISHDLILRLHECASIRRWNDHVRPVDFTELDKQAHKFIIAWVLGKFEELSDGKKVDWQLLIEGGIFEFLHRIVLTDIKPVVFHNMMREKGSELNQWVLKNLDREISDVQDNFQQKFVRYLTDPDYAKREKRLLQAAHYLATQWEFDIIYKICPFFYGIEKTKDEIENQLEDYYDLNGVQRIALGRKAFGFISLCGQLRFQRRWSQSPRIPETSVLGHMLIVAILTYLFLLEMDACSRRRYNSFFAALFHDLPEVLTRDITSPVKNAVEGLDDIIKEYERIQVEERLLPLLPPEWHHEIIYFTENEFENKIRCSSIAQTGLTIADLNGRYNEDRFDPCDGELIRVCDHLAAFVEASLSIQHGITSKHLRDGKSRLLKQYRDTKLAGIDFGRIFRDFAEGAGA